MLTKWEQFIRGGLTQKFGLQDAKKEKGYADEVDMDILLTQLWCHDVDEIEIGRYRVQMALLIMISYFTCARAGSLLPTQDEPRLYLRYRDFRLILDRRDDGEQRFSLVIRQNNMKNQKRNTDQ